MAKYFKLKYTIEKINIARVPLSIFPGSDPDQYFNLNYFRPMQPPVQLTTLITQHKKIEVGTSQRQPQQTLRMKSFIIVS